MNPETFTTNQDDIIRRASCSRDADKKGQREKNDRVRTRGEGRESGGTGGSGR